jgi:hypothetical protein
MGDEDTEDMENLKVKYPKGMPHQIPQQTCGEQRSESSRGEDLWTKDRRPGRHRIDGDMNRLPGNQLRLVKTELWVGAGLKVSIWSQYCEIIWIELRSSLSHR